MSGEYIIYIVVLSVFIFFIAPVFAVFVLGSIFLHGLLKIVFKLETAQEIEVLKRNLIEKAGYFLGILFIAISIYLGVTSYDWDWRFVRPEFSSQASWSDTSGIMGLIFLAGTFQVRKNRSVFSVLLVATIMMPLIFFSMMTVFSTTGIIASLVDFYYYNIAW